MTREHVGVPHDLTRIIVGMKWAMLRNTLLKDPRRRVTFLVLLILAVFAGAVGCYGFWRDGVSAREAWSRSLVPGCTMIFAGWSFGPLLLGGVDDAVEPSRLSMLGLSPAAMQRAVVVSSLIGPLPAASAIASVGIVAGHVRSVIGGLLIVTSIVVLLAASLLTGRVLAVWLALSRRTRRGRDASMTIAALAAATLWFATQSLRVLTLEQFDRVVAVLRWLPAGGLGQAIADAHDARPGVAAVRIVAGALFAGAMLVLWRAGLERLLASPVVSVRERRRRNTVVRAHHVRLHTAERSSSFELFFALVGRELRYLSRSPHRRSAVIVGTAIGAPFALLQAWRPGGIDPNAVFFAPCALLFGIGISNNLLGLDSEALWIEQSTGLRPAMLIRARSIGAAPFMLIPVAVASVILAAFSGGWRQLAFLLPLVVACVAVPLAIGTLLSVFVPFGQPDSDDPFSNNRPAAGEGCAIGLLGVVGLFATAAILVPILWFAVDRGVRLSTGLQLVPVAAVYSTIVWLVATTCAARRVPQAIEILVTDRSGGR